MEAVPELSAKEMKAAEKAARKIELAAKKDARLSAKKNSATTEDRGIDEESELREEINIDGAV